MKKEKLLRAMTDVGDDLLHMAATRRFSSPWRRWITTAACIVLVISLTTLVLPYLPMGCGSAEAPGSTKQDSAETAAPESTESEITVSEPAVPESTAPEATEHAPANDTELPMPEAEEGAPEAEPYPTDLVIWGSTRYYLDYDVAKNGETPGNLGEELGTVEDSDREELIGCPVYAAANTVWYDNHAVDGVSVPAEIYVLYNGNYIFGRTGNEKTVSRYTAADVQAAVDSGDNEWILNTFVRPVHYHGVTVLGGKSSESEILNRLFLASLQMNTGKPLNDMFYRENGDLLVSAEAVERRLSLFLDSFTYDPTATAEWDPDLQMLRFSAEEPYQEAVELGVKRVSAEGSRVWIWVTMPKTYDPYGEMCYELRFDEDSWRYINISTPG